MAIAVAYGLEFRGGNPHKKKPASDVAEARGLEPGTKRRPVDLFFECTQYPCPRVGNGGGGGDKRHTIPSFNADCLIPSAKCKGAKFAPIPAVRAVAAPVLRNFWGIQAPFAKVSRSKDQVVWTCRKSILIGADTSTVTRPRNPSFPAKDFFPPELHHA